MTGLLELWLMKRDSGQYWPSVCQYMAAGATSMHYCVQTRQLFVGLENGTINEFILEQDYNQMTAMREYPAHQARVTGVIFAPKFNVELDTNGVTLITTLKAHTGSIHTLAWDSEKQLLFSGSFDQSIIVWILEVGKVQRMNFKDIITK
ncbi:hypothetical protein K0M31_013816 [Melipona bicolor]|uniref:Uncharacterized protein n=1 Tax=Melipona bicolor TaxID=60889 RepID=A0AA40G7K4_9HYME|nr:hypothetical protein K0M31_013816 [Melipona bicolor]